MLSARRPHRRRRDERGQVLLIAIAFLALFSLWGVAVLRLAGSTQGTLGAASAADARNALAEGPAVFARGAVAQGAGCDGLSGSVSVGGEVVSFGPMSAHDPSGRPLACPVPGAPAATPAPGTYSASGTAGSGAPVPGSSIEVGVGSGPGKTLSTESFNYR